MFRILTLALLCALAATRLGVGGPLVEVNTGKRELIKGSESWKAEIPFRGGERACVIAIGDHRQGGGTALKIMVYDEKNRLVAQDDGHGQLSGDFTAAVWYPPRDGKYRIEVYNPDANENEVYISIK
jgi:hypothetical protein